MEVSLVIVQFTYLQGNGDDDVEFHHEDVDSVWFEEDKAKKRAAEIRTTWVSNNVKFLDDVEVKNMTVQK